MSVTVEFHGYQGEKIVSKGTLTWDGSEIVADPDDSVLLNNVLHDTMRFPEDEQDYTRRDGEDFLRMIPFNIKSSYLWATIKEDAE